MKTIPDSQIDNILGKMRNAKTKKQRKALYDKYLKTEHWRELRETVGDSCAWTCQKCNDNKMTQVHHKTYARLGHEHLDDLIGLCGKCHTKEHGIKKKKKKWDSKNSPKNRGAETQRIAELTDRVIELEETVSMLMDKISHLF